ncbi:hypothetical protein [Aquabacter cavernae]|uniref:hypothetical protein n=1 Tax=Aquabacter cavernae TaxID=2496029 RepID=UPI000F8DDE55|nr:hypothetical protein [Aquabacter cavernae]
MPDPSPQPEPGARVRALYAAGRAVRDIRAETGLSYARIYYWLDNDTAPDGLPRPRPLPRRKRRRPVPPALAAERRQLLAQRIWRAAEAQVGEIEARMGALESGPAQAERDARALAVLARVVRDLSALDAAPAPPARPDPSAPEDDLAFSDLDTFRRELARRLDALRDDGEP